MPPVCYGITATLPSGDKLIVASCTVFKSVALLPTPPLNSIIVASPAPVYPVFLANVNPS